MTRAMTTYERLQADSKSRPGLRTEELILQVTCALSEEMDRQEVNKAELARRLETTRGHVTQLLGGGRNLTLSSIARMADVLGCAVEIRLSPRSSSNERRESLERAMVGGLARRDP